MKRNVLVIALVASVALNLFAAAAGATLLVGRDRVEQRVEEQRRPGRRVPFFAALEGLDPAVRERVRDAMRTSARAAHDDFEQARSTRRAAVEKAGAEGFDAPAVQALLAQSREAELRGRARLENDMIALFSTLEPEERAALAPMLARTPGSRDRGRGGDRNRRRDAPPPADAPAG